MISREDRRRSPGERRAGGRLFSRRVLDRVVIESTEGFCYSIELLVKCHRLGWRIDQIPARWFERKAGETWR